MAQRVPLGGKIDLGTEVKGVLPIGNTDPSVQTKVSGLVTLGSTGNVLSPGLDGSYNLQLKRLKAGTNVSFVDDGNAITIAASSSVGGGDMLKSVYDIGNTGQVDHATLADTVAVGSIGTASIAANAVTAAKIANATITNTQLASGAAVANIGFTPVTNARNVNTTNSLTGGGALSADLTLNLVNDTASPGNNKVYGTNGSGVRGWQPAGLGDMTKAVYDVSNHGWVDRAASADTVAALGVGTASIAALAVTAAKIANATITGTQMAAGAAVANLGFTPINRAGDSGITGDLTVTANGPTIDNSAYLNGHLALKTSGNSGGYPSVGFGRVGTSDGTGGGVAVYFTGIHADLSLRYADGTTGTLLSSNSAIVGSQLSTGTVPPAALTNPNDPTKWLRGDATFASPTIAGPSTDGFMPGPYNRRRIPDDCTYPFPNVGTNGTLLATYPWGWYASLSTGAAVAVSAVGNDPFNKALGVYEMVTGVTAGVIASRMYTAQGSGVPYIQPGIGQLDLYFRFAVGALPTAANNYTVRLGLWDSTTNNRISLALKYDATTGAPVWFGECVSAATASSTSLATSPTIVNYSASAATFYKGQVSISADWTSVTFFVNGTQIGSAITTNIPATTVNGVVLDITRTAGAVSRGLYVDHVLVDYQYSV